MKKISLKLNSMTMMSIFSLAIIIVMIAAFCFYPQYFNETTRALVLIVSLVALFLGWKQLRANHDWNRRSLTITQINELIAKLRNYRMELDKLTTSKDIIEFNGKFISFTDRVNFYRKHSNEIQGLTPDELHKWVCKKDDEGKIEYIQDSSENKICKTSKEGELIVHYILMIINTYEEIATAVKHHVYDKEIVLDLLENAIVKNYKFFELYIQHRRAKHDGKHFAENFEALYKEIAQNDTQEEPKRSPTDD